MMMNDPMDMFEEMDAMFARLFSQMDREFMAGFPQGSGYRILIRGDDEETVRNEAAPVIAANSCPATDVQHVGDEVKVVADLPGITAESLRLAVRNGMLVIDAGDADYSFNTSVALPRVDPASMLYTMKNGVLEVTFRAIPGGTSRSGARTT